MPDYEEAINRKGLLYRKQAFLIVGMAGFEPATSSTPCWRDTRLRYIPMIEKKPCKRRLTRLLYLVVHPRGFEPLTLGAEIRYSIQLNYGCRTIAKIASMRGIRNIRADFLRGSRTNFYSKTLPLLMEFRYLYESQTIKANSYGKSVYGSGNCNRRPPRAGKI